MSDSSTKMDNKLNNDSNQQPLYLDEKPFQDFEFNSFSDFNDTGCNLSNSGVSGINVEDFAFQELDLDAKYRSIQAVNPNSVSVFSNATWNTTAPPQLSKSSSSAAYVNTNQLLTKSPPAIVVTSGRNVVVPEQPFFIAVTQFSSSHDIDTVISIIEQELSSVSEVSFLFYPDKCRWESMYLSGPTRCKFEFNVFKNGHGSHIVEGNRLSGEGFPFSAIFKNIRSKFAPDGVCSSPNSVVNFQFIPLPDCLPELTSADILEAVAPILTMAASGMCESQVNAAQMFCDLSLQQEMNEVLCDSDCIDALVNLCRVEFDSCNQHAICALANLSSSRSCQEALLQDKTFLRHLMNLSRDGTFHTAEMRRESARILANVCSVRANAVMMLEVVHAGDMDEWMISVEGIQDERLRLHTGRAKHSLRAAAAAAY